MAEKLLNILVVNYEYPPVGGGGGYICRNVIEELSSRGHSITVVTSQYKQLPTEETVNSIKIIRVPVLMRNKQDSATLQSLLSFVPSAIRVIKKLVKQNNYDLINTHFAVPTGPVGHFIAKSFNLPNVLVLYGGDIYDPTKSLSPHKTPGVKQVVKKMLASADGVISDSYDIEKHSRNFYGTKRDIRVIPPGVKPFSGAIKSRKELGLPEDKIILTTLGRLVNRKNNVELLEIFGCINEKYPCHLVIMGEGEDRPNIERKVNELGLENVVTLTGRVGEEKFQIMLASDIYVSAATHEGFGLVFLEAMEGHLPIICYNNGGQVDFLKDGITGYLVELGDKKSFSEKLIHLVESKEMRKRISEHNKNYVKNFYINKCANEYLEEFYKVIR